MAKIFEVGKTYSTRSACDYNNIYSFEILSRTAKTVVVPIDGQPVRLGLRIGSDGVERFHPFGRYSMAPVVSADRPDDVVRRDGASTAPTVSP